MCMRAIYIVACKCLCALATMIKSLTHRYFEFLYLCIWRSHFSKPVTYILFSVLFFLCGVIKFYENISKTNVKNLDFLLFRSNFILCTFFLHVRLCENIPIRLCSVFMFLWKLYCEHQKKSKKKKMILLFENSFRRSIHIWCICRIQTEKNK